MTSRTTTVEERLRKALGPGLLTRELLRHHTTFRIGGPADFFFAALEPDQLVAALKVAHEIRVPVFLLGGGSNLLVSDEGFRGLVVKNACASTEFDGAAVQVGCGADFLELILQCRDRELAGLEFAAGIPGSVGGALYGNAGCRGMGGGDAMVFSKHANIIVNAGHATAREVLELAETMKAKVRERFGVELEEEVMFLGERPKL